jgi:hypothetical protein
MVVRGEMNVRQAAAPTIFHIAKYFLGEYVLRHVALFNKI